MLPCSGRHLSAEQGFEASMEGLPLKDDHRVAAHLNQRHDCVRRPPAATRELLELGDQEVLDQAS